MKTETWNGHEIRFVFHENEWWAVAKDVAIALDYSNHRDAIANHCEGVALSDPLETAGGKQRLNIIPELDIYSIIFGAAAQSKSEVVKAKAREFKKWVFEVIRELRKASGLEGLQVFCILNKEHQREAIARLHEGLEVISKTEYIKSNTIANKAISTKHGYPKMLKKRKMTPEMLVERQAILDATVELMIANSKFGLGISVSEKIYSLYCSA